MLQAIRIWFGKASKKQDEDEKAVAFILKRLVGVWALYCLSLGVAFLASCLSS